MIDLRSDTVTQPTDEMRKAMAQARVGDDVYGEDPTVNELEKTSAVLIGKEAALFVPSGTMGNQIALLVNTRRGDEVIVDADSHLAYYEVGAPAMFAGVQLRTIRGLLTDVEVDEIYQAYRVPDIHFPTSRLLCLENTFNRGGGTVLSPEQLKMIRDVAQQLNLLIHLDGARIFNAAAAVGCDVQEFTCHCDTVMFCLSKGLAAPAGSMLAGSNDFITTARKYRKALGGGMRQAGILAAAGLVALNMKDRLAEDHANAHMLAEGLNKIEGLHVDMQKVQSNMVVLNTSNSSLDAPALTRKMNEHGVNAFAIGPQSIRFVTHKDVLRDDVAEAIDTIRNIISTERQKT